MRNHIFDTKLAAVVFFPALMAGCNSDSLMTTPQGDTSAVITAANVGVVTGETTTITDVVRTVVSADDSLMSAANTTLSCSSMGYGGDGTISASGALQKAGDKMIVTYSGCTVAGSPIAGAVGVTLNNKFQNDDGEGFSTSFTYQDFSVGSGNSMFTMNGSFSIESNYDYLTNTATTTRTTTDLRLQQPQMTADVKNLRCVDTYTGLWDTGPFTTECNLTFHSAALEGSVSAETVETFRGIGGESQPTSGVLVITGANNSKTRITAQADGEHALVSWDEDGDDVYEGQLLRTWAAIKLDMVNWSSFFK